MEKITFSEQDALIFAGKVDEVARFLSEGTLIEKMARKVSQQDFIRLLEEYPALFPLEIFDNPIRFQVFAVIFIRDRGSIAGHAKMKIYVDMTSSRVLKIFSTN